MTEFVLEVVNWLPDGVPALSVRHGEQLYWFVAEGLIRPCAANVLSQLATESLSLRFTPRKVIAL